MDETMMEFMQLYLGTLLVSVVFGVVSYVLTSLSYYTIAKRRSINKPWLAWIPIASAWIVGSLSDQYRYVTRRQITNKRKVLLGLEIALSVMLPVLIGMYINLVVTVIMGSVDGVLTDAQTLQLTGQLFSMLGICFVMMPVGIVQTVFHYIALYDVYRSCDPSNGTLYLVLTILVGVVQPFFLFSCRNKDEGMPPRTNVDPAAMPLE